MSLIMNLFGLQVARYDKCMYFEYIWLRALVQHWISVHQKIVRCKCVFHLFFVCIACCADSRQWQQLVLAKKKQRFCWQRENTSKLRVIYPGIDMISQPRNVHLRVIFFEDKTKQKQITLFTIYHLLYYIRV